MARRNRDRNKDQEQQDQDSPGPGAPLLDERPYPSPEIQVKTVPEPEPEAEPKPKPIQSVPERTETLARFVATLPTADQAPFRIERQLATKFRTERRTRAEWKRLYDEYRTRPRY